MCFYVLLRVVLHLLLHLRLYLLLHLHLLLLRHLHLHLHLLLPRQQLSSASSGAGWVVGGGGTRLWLGPCPARP
jgi:hypothetical protein